MECFFSSHILSSTCSSFSCDNRRKKKEKTSRRTLFARPFFECLRIPGLLKIPPASNEETIYIYVFGVTYKRNTYQNVIAWSFACITLTHRSSHSIHQQLPLIPGPLRPIMLVPLIPLGQFWKPESKQTDERLILVNETRFNTANKTWKNLTFWKDKFWAIVSTQLFFRQFTNKKSCEFTFFIAYRIKPDVYWCSYVCHRYVEFCGAV